MKTFFRTALPLLVVGTGLVGLSSCADPYGYGGASYSSYTYSSYPYGYSCNELPYGYRSTYIGGTQYWSCNDHYYRHYPGRGYVVVPRPAGRPVHSGHYDDHRDDYRDRYDDRSDYLKKQQKQREEMLKDQRKAQEKREDWLRDQQKDRQKAQEKQEQEQRKQWEKAGADRRDSGYRSVPTNYEESDERNKSDHRSFAPGADRSRNRN